MKTIYTISHCAAKIAVYACALAACLPVCVLFFAMYTLALPVVFTYQLARHNSFEGLCFAMDGYYDFPVEMLRAALEF